MTQAVSHILSEVELLSPPERADLTDRLMESLATTIIPDIEHAQLAEVRRRVAEIEAGKVNLIPGDEALVQVRRIVTLAVSRADGH